MSLTTWWQGIKDEWAENRERKRLYRELRDAVTAQDIPAVKAALDSGADPNFRPGLNSPHAMATCIYHGNAGIYRMLLDKGGQPNRSIHRTFKEVGYYEKSQLGVAIDAGNAGVAKILAAHPDVDITDGGYHYSVKKGRSRYEQPLKKARGREGMEEVYAILAERTAVNIRDKADRLESEARQIKKTAPKRIR